MKSTTTGEFRMKVRTRVAWRSFKTAISRDWAPPRVWKGWISNPTLPKPSSLERWVRINWITALCSTLVPSAMAREDWRVCPLHPQRLQLGQQGIRGKTLHGQLFAVQDSGFLRTDLLSLLDPLRIQVRLGDLPGYPADLVEDEGGVRFVDPTLLGAGLGDIGDGCEGVSSQAL